MNAKRLLPLAAAGIALAAPAVASAGTYCVHQATACPVGSLDQGNDLQQAFNAAHMNAGADTVVVGPGTYAAPAGGLGAYKDDGLQIVGSGASTVLTSATSPVLNLRDAHVSNLAVQLPSGNNTIGIIAQAPAVIDGVTVNGTSGHHQEAVRTIGGVTVRNSTLTLPDFAGYGVSAFLDATGAPTLEDSTIDAYTSLYVNDSANVGAVAVMRRTTSFNGMLDVMANGAQVRVENAVLHHISGGSEALAAETNWNHDATLTADHVTLIGDGNGTALHVWAGSGATGTVAVTNSTIRNFQRLTNRTAMAGSTANITLAYSDAHPSPNTDIGTGAVTFGAGMLDLATAGFVSGSDQHLADGSALIDAGDPAAPLSASDRDGLPRLSGARQDIGAYEVQVPAPIVPPAADSGATQADAPASVGDDAPVEDAAAPSAQSRSADIRALLRRAITTAHGHRYTFAWPQGGTVRFAWVRHGRTLAAGQATRTSAGTATVTVKGARHLPRGARVRATFAPAGGSVVAITAKVGR